MSIPQNRQELLESIRASYRTLMHELVSVPSALTRDVSLDGHVLGTHMSVSDVVAYLIGWNLLVLKWCEGKSKGEVVVFPETGYKWNELGRLAQKFYADYSDVTYDDLLRRFADVNADIVALVEHETDATLFGAPWYKKYTKGRMIQLNTSSPYGNAHRRLRKWKKKRGM